MYDVIVVGGGHAGCEAALAAARMGGRTLLITMNIAHVAQMSCNPAIGGPAKGHLVREIDALGGEMARVIDQTGVQFRMLNLSKGPAVWAPRAQADRMEYSVVMREVLEAQNGLTIFQGMVVSIWVNNSRIGGVETETGLRFKGRTVILTCGTFLNGLIHVGLKQFSAGRSGEFAAVGLTEALVNLGFEAGRLKTGTPPRVDGRTLDFKKMKRQDGDSPIRPFSFQSPQIEIEQLPCYLTYTCQKTHRILEGGLDRSPLYSGRIVGVGPRYCPSVEDKIVRFKDRDRHQIFLEPEGRRSMEYYINGFATSLPEDVQVEALRTIPGMEQVMVTRFGYAIEYDYFPPTQLKMTLETKRLPGLFFAGQINGTSGYEEAAGQGLVAGINAMLQIRKKSPFVLDRSEAYLGVLVDDLVTKGTQEPYRLFTSRAEYRLLLRQDNADRRLLRYGFKYGLISDSEKKRLDKKEKAVAKLLARAHQIKPALREINPVLAEKETDTLTEKQSLFRLIKRPQLQWSDFENLAEIGEIRSLLQDLYDEVVEQVEIEIKYEGYFQRQKEQIERFFKFENKLIPEAFDFMSISSLSKEAREKLNKIRPSSLGQAARISGVSASDLSALSVLLLKIESMNRKDSS